MKKILLSFSVILNAAALSAQVVVAGVSPQSVVGGYEFTIQTHPGWPGGQNNGTWALALDFNIPGTYIQAEIQLADDGAQGTNAQGNPYSASGCGSQLPDLTGKIAVVFRYDGVDDNPATTAADGPDFCGFAAKALNCQLAGAIAVIVVNRDDQLNLQMTGGDTQVGPPYVGTDVTIPVVMLKNIDGEAIVSALQNGAVEMFIGNKTGAFANDIAINPGAALAPKAGHVHSLLAQNGTEFNFDLGARIYNPGSAAQQTVSLNATITNPSGAVVYDNTVSGLSIVSGDSADVYPGSASTLPNFSLSSYPAGIYTVTYTADFGGTDEYNGDNTVAYTFTVNDSVFSYAKRDTAANSLSASNFYRPSTNNQSYSVCTVINDPNASRVAATGVYFAATTAATATGTTPLDGEEMALYLFSWDDAFTDLNDVNFPVGTAWTLTEVASGFYYYPSDLQGEVVYGAFNTPYVLVDNQRYLACVQTVNLDLYLGYDDQNYTWNTDYYLQPMFPNESDGTRFAVGFGSDLPSALGIRLIDKNSIGLAETDVIEGVAYPNPTTDKVTVSIEGEGLANLTVTDIAGRVAMSNIVSLTAGKAELNIANLEAGVYIFNVVLENGKTAQFNVVKK